MGKAKGGAMTFSAFGVGLALVKAALGMGGVGGGIFPIHQGKPSDAGMKPSFTPISA